MTHLLDTSALLAHHFDEPGADAVQALFDDNANVLGICVLTLLEFESRLRELGATDSERRTDVLRYRLLLDEIVEITETVCATAIELKFSATARLPNMDALIAAAAKSRSAVLVHRDPHFLRIPAALISQEVLPQK